MNKREKQVMESYRRAQGFLDAHPLPAPDSYGIAKQTLDDVVTRLAVLSTSQVEGARSAHNESARLKVRIQELREQHLRPIARIAKAALRGSAGIEVALRLPAYHLGSMQLLATVRAIRNAVTPYREVFVSHSLPEDFLEQLDAAIAAIDGSLAGRALSVTARAGANDGLAEEIRRGRRALDVLDALVQKRFSHNREMLGAWKAAKKVHAVAVGGASPGSEVEDGGHVEPLAA